MRRATRNMGQNIHIENLALLGADGVLWKVSFKDSSIEFRRTRVLPPWSPWATSPPSEAVGSKTTLSTYLDEKVSVFMMRQKEQDKTANTDCSRDTGLHHQCMVYCTLHIYAAKLVYTTLVPSYYSAWKLETLTFPSRILA
jgi:hypothetical protein